MNRKFKGIHRDALLTTHTGTYKIYDYMRKRMGKPDEKQVSTPAGKPKTKTTPKCKSKARTKSKTKTPLPIGGTMKLTCM